MDQETSEAIEAARKETLETARKEAKEALEAAQRELKSFSRRWFIGGGRIVAIVAILLVAFFAMRCFSPAVIDLQSGSNVTTIDSTYLWFFALAGLYMAAVAIAGIVSIAAILKAD